MTKFRTTFRLPHLLLFASLLLLTACGEGDHRPPATGKEGTISIVMSDAQWDGIVGEAVRSELARPVETLPVPEPAFDLEQFDLTTSDLFKKVIQRRKYVLFAATLDERSNVANYIRSGLDEATLDRIRSGEAGILKRPNPWYRNQLVVYAIGATEQDLVAKILEQGEDLRYVFDQATRERLTERMFRRMRQTDLEERLMDGHEFAVNVQHDFFIAQDTLNFIRMRRVLSDTWREVFVYYVDNANPNMLDEEWIISTRDSLTERFVRGTFEGSYVKVDQRRPLTFENINFLDRFGYETRGLWHMTEDAMGGPLLNYSFYDEEQRRIYMIDGMVFAPAFNKREFLRQVEAVAYSFRTRPDEGPATASVSSDEAAP